MAARCATRLLDDVRQLVTQDCAARSEECVLGAAGPECQPPAPPPGPVLADAGPPGSRCVVAVRPERVAIAAIPARDFGEEGALAAMVIESIFQGDHIRLKVSLGDRGEIVAKRPAMGPPPPPPGTQVSVAWQASNARAFRPEGEGR